MIYKKNMSKLTGVFPLSNAYVVAQFQDKWPVYRGVLLYSRTSEHSYALWPIFLAIASRNVP